MSGHGFLIGFSGVIMGAAVAEAGHNDWVTVISLIIMYVIVVALLTVIGAFK